MPVIFPQFFVLGEPSKGGVKEISAPLCPIPFSKPVQKTPQLQQVSQAAPIVGIIVEVTLLCSGIG